MIEVNEGKYFHWFYTVCCILFFYPSLADFKLFTKIKSCSTYLYEFDVLVFITIFNVTEIIIFQNICGAQIYSNFHSAEYLTCTKTIDVPVFNTFTSATKFF